MNDRVQYGRPAAPAGLVLVVCVAATVLVGAVLALLDRQAPPLQFAEVVALRSAGAAGSGQPESSFEAWPQREITALASSAPARPGERSSDAVPSPSAASAAADASVESVESVESVDALDAFTSVAGESNRAALLVPVARAARPGRHEAIATRLGWAPGDARTQILATWLNDLHGRSEADLVAFFGATDAAAIARDLATAAVEDH